MGGFKRFCLALWSLAGIAGVAALALTIVGPWTSQAAAMLAVGWYWRATEVCCTLLLAGLLVTFVRALVSRRSDSVEVTTVDGGSVTITRDAIASQAAHVVGADGTCAARDVFVSGGRRGSVNVRVRVLPYSSVDVMTKGPELHERLVRELAALCGEHLDQVSIEFLEAQQPRSVVEPEQDAPVARTSSEITFVPRAAEAPAPEPMPEPTDAPAPAAPAAAPEESE